MAREPKTQKLREGVPYYVRTEDIETDRIRSNNKTAQSQVLKSGEEEVLKPDESMVVSEEFEIEPGAELEVKSDGTDTGVLEVLGPSQDDLNEIQNTVFVDSLVDLPTAVNGEIQLENQTTYYFTDFVVNSDTLVLNDTTVLAGSHPSQGGYIHTGGTACLKGRGSDVFLRGVYLHAPGGTLFDVQGTNEEFIAQISAFSDPIELGEIASLGTIDGFRSPTFITCNIEDMAGGLTFTGSCDKIAFINSPIRTVKTDNVTVLNFDSNLDCDIVDINGCYLKSLEPDTQVIYVDPNASITNIFRYIQNSADASVNKNNILNGAASIEADGYIVSDSYPLRDSSITGEIFLDSPTTTSIQYQDQYVDIQGSTSLTSNSERVTNPSDGVIRYVGVKDAQIKITSNANISRASDGSEFVLAIEKNGSVIPRSEIKFDGQGNTSFNINFSTTAKITTSDSINMVIKNINGTNDVEFNSYDIAATGVI